MTWSDLILFRSSHDDIFGDIWLTGAVYVWALTVLATFGYLVLAKELDVDVVFNLIVGGIIIGLAWPLMIAGGILVGIVLGSRALVHGRALEFLRSRRSRASRRDLKIAELEQMNARLEQELGLTGEADG